MPKKRPSEDGGGEAAKPAKLNKTESNYTSQDFSCDKKTKEGRSWNFKISTWNVDGLRAWVKKGGLEFLDHEKPDVICLQEMKCSEEKLPKEVKVRTSCNA